MKNEQFYKITLTDCGIPNFCSGGKDYYGNKNVGFRSRFV